MIILPSDALALDKEVTYLIAVSKRSMSATEVLKLSEVIHNRGYKAIIVRCDEPSRDIIVYDLKQADKK